MSENNHWVRTAIWSNDKSFSKQERVVALDYLRVIAVIVLFFFHLGMIWVPEWEFHFKQPFNGDWLQNVLMLTSPWRMGLLWFIAGASLNAMQQKKGLLFLITRRSNTVLLPLLIGIYFVVPIQLFVEMTQKQATSVSFLAFLGQFYFGGDVIDSQFFAGFESGIWHHIDVNHLWFLRSLWRFTLVLVLVLALFQPILSVLKRRYGDFNVYWFTGLILLSLLSMYIENSDNKRDFYGFICLLCGYCFGLSASFWKWLHKYTKPLLLGSVVLTLFYEVGFTLSSSVLDNDVLGDCARFAYYNAKIVALFAVLALAHRTFTKPNVYIQKANGYVFPFYLIHQSVLIAVAFWFSSVFLWPSVAMFFTGLISLIICIVILGLCKYSVVFGVLLGKRAPQSHWSQSKNAQIVIGVITLPLALRLIGF